MMDSGPGIFRPLAKLRRQPLCAVLSLVLYVSAIGLGIVDVAFYGAENHEHYGQPCPLHHFLKQSDESILAAADAAIALPNAWLANASIEREDIVLPYTSTVYTSRAPPGAIFS